MAAIRNGFTDFRDGRLQTGGGDGRKAGTPGRQPPMASRTTSKKARTTKAKATRSTRSTRPKTASKPKADSNGMADRPIKPGFVSHTEFASSNPAATKEFLTTVFGYKFGAPAETPNGPYHMWQHSSGDTGGGIRGTMPNEPAGVTPYVEVKDIDATYRKALAAGAKEMFAPMPVGNGSGRIACVAAPGGGMVGLWSNK